MTLYRVISLLHKLLVEPVSNTCPIIKPKLQGIREQCAAPRCVPNQAHRRVEPF